MSKYKQTKYCSSKNYSNIWMLLRAHFVTSTQSFSQQQNNFQTSWTSSKPIFSGSTRFCLVFTHFPQYPSFRLVHSKVAKHVNSRIRTKHRLRRLTSRTPGNGSHWASKNGCRRMTKMITNEPNSLCLFRKIVDKLKL